MMHPFHSGGDSPLIGAVLVTGLVISVITDLRQGRIFDRVTVSCMALGLLLNGLLAGWMGAAWSVAGMATAIGLALALTLAAGRGLGGGDVKLLIAIGALRGPEFTLWTCLFAALAGPVFALAPLLRGGLLRYTLRNFAHNAVSRYVWSVPVEIAAGTRAGKQPFSLAIAAGVFLAALYGGGG